jgi:hypothetical protein
MKTADETTQATDEGRLDRRVMALVQERDDDAEMEAQSLKQQLATAERLALVAGLPLAAQWIRDHSEHAVVWVEDGEMHPVEMLAWVAKERGLKPITCAVCGHVATEVDSLHPYHQEWDRCAAHSPRRGGWSG